MTTTKEALTEVRDGVTYILKAVKCKSKGVGFAPARMLEGETADDKLDKALEVYGSEYIVKQLERMNTTDAENAVRAKYNKDKVSATTIINAQASGELTLEMMANAKKDFDAEKFDHNWTRCCANQLGLGDDALKNANASHIHWDCAK